MRYYIQSKGLACEKGYHKLRKI